MKIRVADQNMDTRHFWDVQEMGVMMESMKVVLASLVVKVTPLLILALW